MRNIGRGLIREEVTEVGKIGQEWKDSFPWEERCR